MISPATARAGQCQAVSTQHLVRPKQHANGGAIGTEAGKNGTTEQRPTEEGC